MTLKYEPYNPNNPEHGTFILTLLREVGPELCPDHHQDYLMTIRTLDRTASQTTPNTFIVQVDGERAGYINLMESCGVGTVEGAALKRYQNYHYAKNTTEWFCQYAYQTFEIHKLRAIVPIRKDRLKKRVKWEPAELVLRRAGFVKEGLLRKELIFNGRATDAVLLALFPHQLRKKPYEQ